MKNKIIVTDVDGCLVDWDNPFNAWMAAKGYVQGPNGRFQYNIKERFNLGHHVGLVAAFNKSENIATLAPLRDAVEYVQKLHVEHGYEFHCITSLGNDPAGVQYREANLRALFGETAFTKILCLSTGGDKTQALSEYKDSGCFWIEDHTKNAVIGSELGLRSLLMRHDYNQDHAHENVRPVQNWQEIYNIITA